MAPPPLHGPNRRRARVPLTFPTPLHLLLIILTSPRSSTEDFSYFTLRHSATADSPATSLFGISCTRQLDAAKLRVRPKDVTRSTVQKAVVVISDSPQFFGMVREKLASVTAAWFRQRYVGGVWEGGLGWC